MKVFKFGGASIRDAESIKNMAAILAGFQREPLLVVISAIGKTTNALEEIVKAGFIQNDFLEKLEELKKAHIHIISQLIPDRKHPVYAHIARYFGEIQETLQAPDYKFDFDIYYDQVVSKGELISSMIVSHYLEFANIHNTWFDAREAIKTDEAYREAAVDWDLTRRRTTTLLPPMLTEAPVITQGFIGSSLTNLTSTLGREGSDFSAAIFAHCLKAESVTIWKDVPGILNADPKLVQDTIKIDELSYNEAAEMAYYGAQVIHPKTIKPLANSRIPLLVKSFQLPQEKGTIIHERYSSEKLPPTIIFKFRQCLVSFYVKDLAFLNEKNLSIIFHALDKLNIRINVMQNSAVSFSICMDEHVKKLEGLQETLQQDFDIRYNENLTLITIKNYDPESIERYSKDRIILLELRSRNTFQIVTDA